MAKVVKWGVFALGVILLGILAYVSTQGKDQRTRGLGPRENRVRIAQVQVQPLRDRIEALGTLRANEAVTIVAESEGIAKEILFQEGSDVEKGQLLVRLDRAEEDAEVNSARVALEEAQRQYNRLKELAGRNTVAEVSLDQQRAALSRARADLRVAEARLQARDIRAPFSGQVGLRQISPGDLMRIGDPVTTLDDLKILKLNFAVPEKFLASLKRGIRIEGMTAAYPDQSFPGVIETVDTRVDAITRTINTVALVDNQTSALKPGQSMSVDLYGPPREALTVPNQSTVSFEDRQYVYVVVDDKSARRQINIGNRYSEFVEVTSGLKADEFVVVEGIQSLGDGEAPVIVMSGGPNPAATRPQETLEMDIPAGE